MIRILAMLVGLSQPVADISTTAVTSDQPELGQQAITFMEGYFQHLSSSDVLTQFEHDYADYIAYFSEAKPKAEVLREKAAFVRRWPQRSYRPRQASIQAACRVTAGEGFCAVTGLVDFECSNPERHAVSAGVARFLTQIWFSADHPQIIVEDSAVVG